MRPFQMQPAILVLLLFVMPLLLIVGVWLSSGSGWLMLGCVILCEVGRRLILRRLKRFAESPEATWSPFQSPEVRDIYEHMTAEEKRRVHDQSVRDGARVGVLIAWGFGVPLLITLYALLFSIRYRFVLLGLFALYAVAFGVFWSRFIRAHNQRTRQILCETEHAKMKGYRPDTLRRWSFSRLRRETE